MSTRHAPVLAIRPDVRPEIVCPTWCTVTYEEHYEELGEWEGFVIHKAAPRGGVQHTRETYPDNTLKVPPLVFLEPHSDLSLEEAEALARTILDVVEEARASDTAGTVVPAGSGTWRHCGTRPTWETPDTSAGA